MLRVAYWLWVARRPEKIRVFPMAPSRVQSTQPSGPRLVSRRQVGVCLVSGSCSAYAARYRSLKLLKRWVLMRNLSRQS